MPIGFSAALRQALTDGRIDSNDYDVIEAAALRDGRITSRERRGLNGLLSQPDKLEAGVDQRIRATLGLAPPPPAGDATADLKNLLDRAAQGGLSGSELAAAEADIKARYGADVARQAMRTALGDRLGELTTDGVTWIQQAHATYDGKLKRLQQVIDTHLKGADLIDANFNGRLDAGDVALTRGADGKVETTRISQILADKAAVGAAMVGACEAMDRAGHAFELIKNHRCNAAYWTLESGSGVFKRKEGVSPSDALEDIFKNPSQYGFECATALVIVYYKAMYDLVGRADFDRLCKDVKIGPWAYEGDLSRLMVTEGNGSREASPERRATLRAGEYGYFMNWDVSAKGRDEGWQGENVIFLGGQRFYGHPFGIATEREIVSHLNEWRKPSARRSASLLDLRMNLSTDVLAEDKTPG